ncbi:putative rna annealing protein [Phaeomoniella chlamydospora]|uniref:Putative rna annealing protein n=1 Tax=Phaeomoniella chlamydospora TaxID=158046 RepID=A0A0G2GCX0_PHACM|nr:putative rna annealing protein [Phaeomoniella chlamydospora]
MSGKLDQSLDEILSTRRQANRKVARRGAKPGKATGTTPAPAGGIKKTVKHAKSATKAVPSAPAPGPKESKIVVSGLPTDVTEAQIKEYFQKSVGSVKRVIITYNQHGVSRGSAQIYFAKYDAAAKAAKELNGMLVDKKPMKIELVVDAASAPAPAAPKPLGERISANAKAQPKSATASKPKDAAAGRGGRATRGRGRKARTPGRPKKTAEELDQEMTDYMSASAPNTEANGNAAAPAATNGEDLGMDEISVSTLALITVLQ